MKLNGRTLVGGQALDGLPAKGPIRIVPGGPVSMANVYVRRLAKR